jgi:hypothetical protein
MRWKKHVARMSEMRNLCTVLIGKPKGPDLSRDEDQGPSARGMTRIHEVTRIAYKLLGGESS